MKYVKRRKRFNCASASFLLKQIIRVFPRIIHEEPESPLFGITSEMDNVEAFLVFDPVWEGVVSKKDLAVSEVIAQAVKEVGFEGSVFIFGEGHDGTRGAFLGIGKLDGF